ncbi:hypothetical protein Glove_375g90 [Diversispora epigaea]|uniref:Ribosomal RNA-processing protein 14/surfeit locus protein 6 C-terminal domain-containing protein n=1 Tax=Diversispora epigaea TaxID=1348612 RepID=A0A397H939_9GLOM|nr:hypothetical protein Glove_375g90 [Diversispora epigaea]
MALLSWTPESIKERIKTQNHFIESAVSLIPPKNYFKNSEISDDNEIYYNKRKRVSKQLLKEQKKVAKKQKLDPNNLKTVSDIQQENLNKIKEIKKSEVLEVPEELAEQDENIKSKPKDEEHNSLSTRLSITERLSRLRLAKQNFEQDLEKKKEMRKEKNRIKEENKKKKSKNLNQQKELNDNDSKSKEDINQNTESLEQENIQIQDSNNVEGNVMFSKFNFEGKKIKKKLDNVQLMNKLQSHKEKMEKLKNKDPDKATQLHEKEEWRKALQKTRGEKVKDDINLLKKTIKNKTFKKKSSEKAWKERLQTVSKAITEKQEKRTKNIQERINMKKNKKGRKHK